MAKKLKKLARKGRTIVKKAARSKVGREITQRELELAADLLSKAAKQIRQTARKMK